MTPTGEMSNGRGGANSKPAQTAGTSHPTPPVNGPANPLADRQSDLNQTSRGRWEEFAGHRGQVTSVLCAGAKGTSRLCVLGAGNCNDLDLAALLKAHPEAHLVDLDAAAVRDGVARQGQERNPAVACHGGIDLTGLLGVMANWTPSAELADADLAMCREAPTRTAAAALPGPFDVVASTCVLSQLMQTVVLAVGEGHPRFVELLQAVRCGHLRLLAHLIAAGGTGYLITDVVSSETFPELPTVPPRTLPEALARLARAGNFFHGVNPILLPTLFARDSVLGEQVRDAEALPPWCWNLGPRQYAVCAVRVRKK
jgi:hypothetical protein